MCLGLTVIEVNVMKPFQTDFFLRWYELDSTSGTFPLLYPCVNVKDRRLHILEVIQVRSKEASTGVSHVNRVMPLW